MGKKEIGACEDGIVYEYKEKSIKVIGKIEGATSATQQILAQLWLNFVRKRIFVSSFTSNLCSFFFGVELWNPKNMGSHSTDEKSRDQWVKRKLVYVRVGLCINIKKILLRLLVKLRERPLQHSTLQLDCG